MTTIPATDVRRIRLDIGLEPVEVLRRFRGRDRVVALIGDWHHGEALIAFDPVRVLDGHPFDDVDLPAGAQSGVFGGGWIGSWGYQLGHLVEELPPPANRPVPQPYARVAFYDRVLRLTDGVWWLETLGRIDDADVLAALDTDSAPESFDVGTFSMTPSPDEHRTSVARALEHIRAGDIFQVNLTARLEAPFEGDPLDLFCAGVEELAPAYAAFVDAPEGAVASFSPELFLRRTGDEVLTSPIKGTAPLDSDPDELTASAKNRAENVMIVDLMRNDLGRVCTPGSVRVPALVRAERHAVWHLVSDVIGHLGPDVTDSALLRATFPPGSVTGAPKVRAMEIAAELEPTAREAYTGAIGHVSAAAGLELNVAIRTFEISGGWVWLGVGGGIVADSTPDGELAECFVKARPLIEAIGGRFELEADAPAETVPPHVAVQAHVDRADLSLGIYDTVLVTDGVAIDVEAHVARLDSSVRAVYGQTVRAGLEQAVNRKAAGLQGRHRLRIDAVPLGPGGGAGPWAADSTDVLVRMTVRPILDDVDAWTLVPRVLAGGLGPHKWSDRRALAHDGRPDSVRPDEDLLVLDDDGSVLETGRASLFLVHDDGVLTPPLDGRILPGTGRARVIDQLLEAGIPVIQRRLTTDDVGRASEVFVTNALRGVVPITSAEGIGSWSAGPLTTSLRTGSDGPGSTTTLEDADSPLRGVAHARVLFVDNYDSFVYNLVQYVRELGASADVVRNDAVTVDELVAARERGELTHVIISPGPGTPTDAGISVDVVRRLGPTTPTLGVCLGHQAIGEAYGALVVRADEVVHGKPSLIHHDGRGVYTDLPSPLVCARYHSLVVAPDTVPQTLDVTARTASGVVMGLRHRSHPVEGVQMHPESILTAHGHDMLARFLGGDD